MRIEVVGDGAISHQARTYAEYRLFAALTERPETHKVRRVRAVLRVQSGSDGAGVACTVTVRLQGSDSIRVRSTGSHPYAAINNAVDRLRASRQRPSLDYASP